MSPENQKIAWVDGRLIPEESPVFPVTVRAGLYGAGCFETFRSFCGAFLHLERHMERLCGGIRWLGAEPPENLDVKVLADAARTVLKHNGLAGELASVRIQASLLGGRGYKADPKEQVAISLTTGKISGGGNQRSLSRVSTPVVPDRCRPACFKLSNTLHYMKAWREADAGGFDDAIMETLGGYVAETPVSNLFWIRENRIFTPSESCDILPGQMRRVFVENLGEWCGLPVQEGQFGFSELKAAELVWTTNSLHLMRPVSRIADNTYPVDTPLYGRIESGLNSYLEEHLV